MYQLEKIRQKLQSGGLLCGANVVFSESAVSELYGFAGCDYVWIDMEHGSLTHKDVEHHIIASHSGGAAAFVRIPWNDQVMVKRIIDMGPDGIIFPFIRTVKDAEDAVSACSYPPKGIRGWNPIRASQYGLADTDWYIQNAGSLVWKILMIEHIDAVNNLEGILKVPGIEAIMIGPSDLSGSMGQLLQNDTKEFWDIIKRITDLARAAKMVIGVAIPPNLARDRLCKWLDYEVNFISFGQDSHLLSSIVKDNLANINEVYGEFKKR
jgi:2-keto-3-deoxy-L-rhamnonate aldolase RhmA